jgi:hypothetical protein
VEGPPSDELIAQLSRDGAALAARFRLRYRVIEAERPRVKRRYGVCYADGTIRIRLRHAATGEPLKYSSLVNTLCHELAHLRHFNHGLRFQRLYREILEYARAAGIYVPGPDGRAVPVPRAPLATLRFGLRLDAIAHADDQRPRRLRSPAAAPSQSQQLTLF